jgi:nucleotide-binding universal stress UspA family protein
MKILLCVDESKHSEAAVEAVRSEFRPQSSQVLVLHVLQPLSFAPPPQMAAQYAPELEQEGKKARELVERAAKILRADGFQAETAIEKGDIRVRIIDTATEWHADLIVMGSHGHSGIPRLLLGSRAEFVARNAPCSVQIVRTPAGK